jgi:hypothetical protein
MTMLLETAVFGVFIGAILFLLGLSGEKKRPAFIIAGAICLLVTGALLGADGLQIPSGTTVATAYTYSNLTGADANYTLVANATDTVTTTYTTTAGIYAGGWALMLIMSAVAGFLAAFNTLSEPDRLE